MNYYYCNRGKCSSCSQIMWTTELSTSNECSCYQGLVSCNPSSSINIVDITDEEFIEAIKLEHGFTEDIVLIKI